MNDKVPFEIDAATAIHLPMSERVLDRLADILYATDEVLGMVRGQERLLDPAMTSVETSMQTVYDQVNELMKRLAD